MGREEFIGYTYSWGRSYRAETLYLKKGKLHTILLSPAVGEGGGGDDDEELLPNPSSDNDTVKSDIISSTSDPDSNQIADPPLPTLIQPQCSPHAHNNSPPGLVPPYIPRA